MIKEVKDLSDSVTVNLAQEKAFRLGPVEVRPTLREVVHDDGRREMLEPRVMQVLVALARAGGEVLSRNDLTDQCWDGRVVGEDAINRVISRLHRLAQDMGGAFRIETVTKVGYRLVPGADVRFETPAPSIEPTNRRGVLVGAGVTGLAAAAAAGGWIAWTKLRRPSLDPAAQALYQRGWAAMDNGTPEQAAQSVALFQQVVDKAPSFADGWGALAYAYAVQAQSAEPALIQPLRNRAIAAADQSSRLSKSNALAAAARVAVLPMYRNWGAAEQGYRHALTRFPHAAPLLEGLAGMLSAVGRCKEAATIMDAYQAPVLAARMAYRQAYWLWSANRIEESDRMMGRVLELYPRSTPVWFSYFNMLARSGRPGAAIAFGEDRARRPIGVPEGDFEVAIASAKALVSKSPADIDRAVKLNLDAAPHGRGYMENAIAWLALMGRLDGAFQLLDDYYFASQPAARAFSAEQGQFYSEPRTHFLFITSLGMLQTDPRFDALMERISLKAYWAASKHPPDYLAHG